MMTDRECALNLSDYNAASIRQALARSGLGVPGVWTLKRAELEEAILALPADAQAHLARLLARYKRRRPRYSRPGTSRDREGRALDTRRAREHLRAKH
jgi:hypothetical protein